MPSDGDKRNLEIAALVIGGVIVPIVTSLLLPALPGRARIPVGIGVGAVLLIGGATLFLRYLLRAFATAATKVLATLEGYTLDPQTGGLFKGRIRNVSLRTATLHDLLDQILRAVPEARREQVLYEAGYAVGASWGSDLEALCHDLKMDADDTASKFELWARYDASAGMGKMGIDVAGTGSGSVTIQHSFLSDRPACTPLNHWFAGYIAGTLEHILGLQVTVQLVDPSTTRQTTTRFTVVALAPLDASV